MFFMERIASRTLKFTGLILLISGMISGLLGTMQQIIPSMANEWSGVFGQFEAFVLSSLIGKVGSLLFFIVALFLTITLGFGISIKTSIETIISGFLKLSIFIDKGIDFIQKKKVVEETDIECKEEEDSTVQ
ncbi:MAG: DNA translocase FtsK 4TM domain-containing protein, partial [bacterium]